MVSREKVMKLAEKCGLWEFAYDVGWYPLEDASESSLEQFAALVRRDTLEEAAKVCKAEAVGTGMDDDCDNDQDMAYNTAIRHCVAGLNTLALASQESKPEQGGGGV